MRGESERGGRTGEKRKGAGMVGEGWWARERGNEGRRAKARGPGEGRGDGKPLHSRQKSKKYGIGMLKSGLTRKPHNISQ